MGQRYTGHGDGLDGSEGHPCARGEHCAARQVVVEAGERFVVAALTYRTFCDADTERVRACLLDLPRRYLELAARSGDKGRSDGPRVSGGGHAPGLIVNLGVDQFQRDTVNMLTSWEEPVRLRARLAVKDSALLSRQRDAVAVASACRVLAAHVDVLLGLEPEPMVRHMDLSRREHLPDEAMVWVHPDAGWLTYQRDLGGRDAGLEILNLHHRYLSWLGWTPRHHDLATPCWNPDCSMRTLRRWDGTAGLADHVECLRCGEEYVGDRLRKLMVAEADLQERRQAKEAS